MTFAGHDEAWREWRAGLAAGRMHHGWLLAGPRGLGKASFALAAAAELVAEAGGQTPPPAAHPDILTLSPLPDNEAEDAKRAEGKPFRSKRSISVEQIRTMQRRLITRPTLGTRRAVIVDAADMLEASAFNALLKTLEEPPQGTFLLLVAHHFGRLPAAIRSRCRMLRFPLLDDAAVGDVLDGALPGLSREVRAAALAIARGSPGAALDFAARDLVGVQGGMTRIAQSGDADFVLRAALLADVGPRPDRERQGAVIDAARRVLVAAVGDAERARQARIVEAHAALAQLGTQAATYNFDPAALVLEIGGLLASVGDPRETLD